MDKVRVGVVGTGRMGRAYAANLLKAGHDVHVYDTNPRAYDNLIHAGARPGKTPAEIAAGADFMITALPRSEIVEAAIIGPEGFLGKLSPGSVVIDMSTTLPKTTRKIADAVARTGSDFLDAPVSGHPVGAINATLTIMVGGKKEVFLRGKEQIFDKLGKNIYHAGPTGAGQALKLVNNLLYNLNRLSMCEGLVLGTKAGIDPEIMRQAISVSTGASYVIDKVAPNILRGDFTGGESSLNLACKTLKLIADFADELDAPLLLGNLAKQIYNVVRARGHGEESPTSVVAFYEEGAGIQVRAAKE